jgi:hypothetical protein
MEWAIEHLRADGVELPDGYTNLITATQLARYDIRLKANWG